MNLVIYLLLQVADIVCYATSSEGLLSVLTEGDLVTWGKRQEFQRTFMYSLFTEMSLVISYSAEPLINDRPRRGQELTFLQGPPPILISLKVSAWC